MDNLEIENIEVELLLEALYQRYGYDFRDYARASLKRRLKKSMHTANLEYISQMIPMIMYDEEMLHTIIHKLSITVSEMFRDPSFFNSLREKVIPILKTYPFIKIWHAGCANGEEAYSLAILLKEEKIYDKCTIYATDINSKALKNARKGIYELQNMQKYTRNYQE